MLRSTSGAARRSACNSEHRVARPARVGTLTITLRRSALPRAPARPPPRRRRAHRASRPSSSAWARLSSWSRWSASRCVTSSCALSTSLLHLLVDQPLGRLRGRARAGQKRALTVGRQHRDRPDRLAHAPAPDHLARDLGELLDVRLGAGGDRAVDDLLGHAPAERHADLRLAGPRASMRRGLSPAWRASRRAPCPGG